MKTFSIDAESIPRFLGLSRRLNGADPTWVPPLDLVLAGELSGRDAFGAYGRMRLFLCESGGEDVGRVAAIVNPRLRDATGAPIGQLGYFECVDDVAVAGALFEEGSAWLRAQGCREVWGPMNGGAHRTHRCLVEGFDRPPFLFEPRNPPHHPRLWEAHGFRVLHRWSTYEESFPALREGLDRLGLLRALERLSRRYERVLPGTRDIPRALARLHPLLDAFWTGHVGYASLDAADFAEAFGGALSAMYDWCLGMAVDRASGRDVACAFAYPDWVAEARALNGDASGWGRWMSGNYPDRLVFHTIAAIPEARHAGAAHFLLGVGLSDFEARGFRHAVVALVTEELRIFNRICPPTRRYVLYARPLV
ncbi:MAG: hypothetical protein AAB434_04725 [Planctomycetota bacterium]